MAVFKTRPILRGDIYYISYNNAVGSEQSVGRPGLIVSSQKGCDTSAIVNVLYLSTQEAKARLGSNVEINSLRKRSWVLCNQFVSVDKSRLLDYYGTLTEKEMSAVDKAMAEVLGIPFGIITDTYESDTLKAENASLEEKLLKKEQEKLDVAVERDFYKKLYESALNRFVGIRLERDLAQEEPKAKPVPKMVPDEPEETVDLNSCSTGDLKRLGLKEDVILRIVQARPFKKVDDLRYIRGITSIGFQIIRDKVRADPVVVVPEPEEPKVWDVPAPPVEKPEPEKPVSEESGKVNVNRAKAKELMALGISACLAYTITGHRNKNGDYGSLEDLLNVRGFSKNMMARFGDKLEV